MIDDDIKNQGIWLFLAMLGLGLDLFNGLYRTWRGRLFGPGIKKPQLRGIGGLLRSGHH